MLDTGVKECQLHYLSSSTGTNNRRRSLVTDGFEPKSFIRLGSVVSFVLWEQWKSKHLTYGLLSDALGHDFHENVGCIIMGPCDQMLKNKEQTRFEVGPLSGTHASSMCIDACISLEPSCCAVRDLGADTGEEAACAAHGAELCREAL